MRRYLLPILGFVGMALASPAAAADVAQIGCVLDHLDAAGRTVITDHAAAMVRIGSDPEGTKRVSIALRTAVAPCIAQFGWSDDAAVAANIYAMATLSAAGGEPVLRERGIDVAKIKRVYAAIPADLRARIQNGRIDDPELPDLLARAMSDADFPADQGDYVGRYAAYLMAIDIGRATFARS